MDYTIDLFIGAGIAAFIALIAFMIGYVWKERQYEQYSQDLMASWQKSFDGETKILKDQLAMHEHWANIIGPWRTHIIDTLTMLHLYRNEHVNDPELALHDLLAWEAGNALNPDISVAARKLINKAKREHGKKLRGQFERKLKREIDKVLSDTQRVRVECDMWKKSSQTNAENMANARFELSMYQGTVSQALDNYIRLPSVRNACQKYINEQHKDAQEAMNGSL